MSHLASQSAQPPLPAYLPGMIRQHIYEPCIPTRGTNARAGPDWLHEIKHDGYRLIVQREGKRVRLLTRRGYDWSDRDPLIAQAALRLRKSSFVIDGEAVVLGPDGISDFAALYAGKRNDEGRLYAFDLLHGDGVDMRDETLQIRKLWLANLLKRSTDGIILNDHESGEIGPDLFRQACKMDLRESSRNIARAATKQGRRSTGSRSRTRSHRRWFARRNWSGRAEGAEYKRATVSISQHGGGPPVSWG